VPSPTPSNQTVTFSGSLNPKNPSRNFSLTIGTGVAHAELSFSKCSSLDLTVTRGASLEASKSGPSVVVLDAALPAGTYIYSVSGGRCSFTLAISSPSP